MTILTTPYSRPIDVRSPCCSRCKAELTTKKSLVIVKGKLVCDTCCNTADRRKKDKA